LTVWAIVVAGGAGSRFGRPKQFEIIAGSTVLGLAAQAARAHTDGLVVVLPAGYDLPSDISADRVVAGGETRSASVRCGLAAVPVEASVIVVHDAARPLASPALFAAVVETVLEGADAALPGTPVADTLRRIGGGTVDRNELLAVQTPQAFAAAVLRQAHAGEGEATDDAALVEQAGGRVVVVPGEPTNMKLTHREDLLVAEAVLRGRAPMETPLRIGHGFDVHPFSDDPRRPLILGGVHFGGHPGLAGHSDADVIAHAVTDALLGAAGLGDIGQLFPDTDVAYANADSLELLGRAVALVRSAGWEPGNVDCTIVAETPRLAPHRSEMEARLSAAVAAPVTLKGKRAEGLGALGRREGLACWAVAIVSRQQP
jgi:2-C-methyl-D-erythritol 4-phosphate cytidylyltransferase/2-C-methyl-D-erythritol 2,4-cyclodiphosphate synthase